MHIFGVLFVCSLFSVCYTLPPCVCTRERTPVCGSNGVTYANRCLLDCASSKDRSIRMVKDASCEGEENQNCICTYEYKPVCGSDGETYPNSCSLRCEQRKRPALTEGYRGACRSVRQVETPKKHSCACTRNLEPVCGTNGVTYGNRCMFNCAQGSNPQLRVLHEDVCEEETKEVTLKEHSCACGRNLQPVCGSNGETYSNKCLLNCAQKVNPEILMVRPNPCNEAANLETPKRHSCACTRIFQPICASNGITYSNPCLMKCAGEELTIKKSGQCDEA